jgi:L-amino acid N-acyltransferase YncA
VKIRPLRTADIPAATHIVAANYSKKYATLAKKELEAMFRTAVYTPTFLVAEEKSEVIGLTGYIQSWMDYQVYHLFWVNVSGVHQGRGVGKKLILEALKRIKKQQGINKARMVLITTTVPAFYTQFNFRKLAKVEKYDLMAFDI